MKYTEYVSQRVTVSLTSMRAYKSTPLVIFFITVIMDVTQTTPTKVIARTSKSADICYAQLCNKNINEKHLLRIYSVSGKEEGLELKILHTCGIHTQTNIYSTKSYLQSLQDLMKKCGTSKTFAKNIKWN